MKGPADLFANRLTRMQDSARLTRAAVTNTKPTVAVELEPSLPAWTLRLTVALLGTAAILLLAPNMILLVILALTLLLVVIRPTATTGAVFCGTLGLFWLIGPSAPFSSAQFLLLAIGPLIWTIGGICTDLPLRTRIEWRSLKIPALRYLIIQAITQLMLAGAQLLQTRGPDLAGPLAGLLAFVGAIGIAVGAWLILPTLTSRANDRRD